MLRFSRILNDPCGIIINPALIVRVPRGRIVDFNLACAHKRVMQQFLKEICDAINGKAVHSRFGSTLNVYPALGLIGLRQSSFWITARKSGTPGLRGSNGLRNPRLRG
jgi:hypothetical protein